MAAAAIVFDFSELDLAAAQLQPLLDLDGTDDLMTSIGALGESQTRRRITSEKTAPDGSAWAPNLEGNSILQRTGQNLLDSITYEADANEARWGATWEHASVHQNGAVIKAKNGKLAFSIGGRSVFTDKVTIPARQFVGISSNNKSEIEDLVTDFVGELTAGIGGGRR
ncbi:MAG: phage virion morphogenesis protein [Pseudomonadota bacterium]